MKADLETIRRELERRSTAELVSILRNRDDDEWRPEAFDVVTAILEARGISPSDVVALGPEGSDVVEAQRLVTLGRYFGPVEAHTHRMALEEAGIEAWVFDERLGTMFGFGIGSRLQVRAEDETAARAVLDAEPAPASVLPEELAEPSCPRCGSTEVFPVAAVQEDPSSPPSDSPRHSWRYQCARCDHHWPE